MVGSLRLVHYCSGFVRDHVDARRLMMDFILLNKRFEVVLTISCCEGRVVLISLMKLCGPQFWQPARPNVGRCNPATRTPRL